MARGSAAVHAPVSSHDRKNDPAAQAGRMAVWAATNGYTVNRVVTETGSGLNPQNKAVVEHRDRLMRFGSEYIEAALTAQSRKLAIVNQAELRNDLVQNMVDVLTSFSARLYGPGSPGNRAKKALKAASK